MEKRIAKFSGAVSLKRQENERYGQTVGTIKVFEATYDTENEAILAKLPSYNGFIIMDKDLALQSIVKDEHGKEKLLLQVAIWDKTQ
jgi:hypothetical protein